MQTAGRWAVCLLLAFAGSCMATPVHMTVAKAPSCPLDLQGGTTLLLVADPGTFSGTPEDAYYVANLQRRVAVPKGVTACVNGYTGVIMGQQVAVITTGIGPTAAALCVYDVVSRCGEYIRDIIFSGTSGWSPQLGGVINNSTCSQGLANSDTANIARTGDVCVSPFSVNWDCRMASWSMTAAGYPNQCTFPQQSGSPAQSSLFGQCQFTDVTPRELALSDEVMKAATAGADSLPVRNNVVQALDVAYWQEMAAGVPNVQYPPLSATAPPRVWGYRQCMEVDSQFFWSGAPWDMVSRAYAADALNKALRSSSYDQTNVIGVSAMEAIGLGMAMEKYNALSSTQRRIPYTVVRGMSDYTHTPLAYQGEGMWAAAPAVTQDLDSGYRYAIATSSGVVLNTLQARCLHRRADTTGTTQAASPAHKSNACTYSIDY